MPDSSIQQDKVRAKVDGLVRNHTRREPYITNTVERLMLLLSPPVPLEDLEGAGMTQNEEDKLVAAIKYILDTRHTVPVGAKYPYEKDIAYFIMGREEETERRARVDELRRIPWYTNKRYGINSPKLTKTYWKQRLAALGGWQGPVREMNACDESRVMAEDRGYIGQMEYLERMSKTNTQHECPKCGLLHIWKRKLEQQLNGGKS